MEIERKFLTRQVPFMLAAFPSHVIQQSYISTYPTIRIRQSDETYWLTIKGAGTLSREEYNLPITKEEYFILQEKAETLPIIKTRYFVPLDHKLIAEIDCYEGSLAGFITTEVEFSSEEEAIHFQPPSWFGKEVTQNSAYTNASLAVNGIPK